MSMIGEQTSRAANLLQDELLADILPPPALVVEPYLHTTRTLIDPAHAGQAKAALAEERSLFEQRKAYWASAPIPQKLRSEVQATIGTANAFWSAVDQRYLPALTTGDIETMKKVHRDDLAPAYDKQLDAVERLVKRSTAYRTDLRFRPSCASAPEQKAGCLAEPGLPYLARAA